MGCRAICCCLSHLARDCNGEPVFGGVEEKGDYTDTEHGFSHLGKYSPLLRVTALKKEAALPHCH